MSTQWIVTLVWLAFTMAMGALGKATLINSKPLPPLLGVIVAPLIVLLIGVVFLPFGAVMTMPIWIWWIR